MEIRVDTILSAEPITLVEAKLHLRVDGAAEDDLITAFITAARQNCEGACKRALIPQRRAAIMDCFPEEIGLGQNVIAVESVTYRDAAGATQTLAESAYRLVDERTLVPVSTWPAGDTVRIKFRCGAFDPAVEGSFPRALKSWMLLQLGALYAQREAVSAGQLFEPPGRFVDSLLDPYRSY